MRFIKNLLLVAGMLSAGPALANCEVFAWKFGISADDVLAIKECGPYKTFRNGDLETYKGVFDGNEENFQFFFKDKKLRRIGVYLYEGNDVQAAGKHWAALGKVMTRYFGAIETPGNVDPGQPAFMDTAIRLVDGSGKTQMAPLRQPNDAAVFSSLMRQTIEGEVLYNVVLYFDVRPATASAAPAAR